MRHCQVAHCEIDKFVCSCRKEFTSSESLNSHSASKHGKAKPVKCQMPDCKQSFASQSARSNHYKAFYTSDKFKCDIPGCEREFSAMKYLRAHTETHHIEQMSMYDEQIRVKRLMMESLSREVERLYHFRKMLLEDLSEDELTSDDIPSDRPDDTPDLNDSFRTQEDSPNDKEL